MKKNILAALVSLSCALGATAANAEDLLQVFEIATANDPTVLKAKAQADAQSYQSDLAMSALLPQIGLTIGSGLTSVGFVVHMLISMAFGAIFGFSFAGRFPQFRTGLALGASYGIFWWIVQIRKSVV